MSQDGQPFGIAPFPPFGFGGTMAVATSGLGRPFGLALFPPFDFGGTAVLVTPPALGPFEVDLFAYLGALDLGAAIYPGHVPQAAALPAICYLAVGEEPYSTLRRAAGLTARNYQFSVLSPSYLTMCRLELALRGVLNGFRGAMGTTPYASARLVQCLDLPYEANVDGSDGGTYQRIAEYRIHRKESIPILY